MASIHELLLKTVDPSIWTAGDRGLVYQKYLGIGGFGHVHEVVIPSQFWC
jgi:hypothetical protein